MKYRRHFYIRAHEVYQLPCVLYDLYYSMRGYESIYLDSGLALLVQDLRFGYELSLDRSRESHARGLCGHQELHQNYHAESDA